MIIDGMPRSSLRAAPGSRRGKLGPPAWTGGYVVALADPCDSLQIVSGSRVCPIVIVNNSGADATTPAGPIYSLR